MKRITILSVLSLALLLTNFSTHAQGFSSKAIYFSLGTSAVHHTGMDLPLEIRVEYGIMKYVSAGIYFSYGTALEKDRYYSILTGEFENLRAHWMFPGACATFHMWELFGLDDAFRGAEKFDLYATGFIGARLGKRTVPKDPTAVFFPNLKRKFKGGGVAGLRFYFIEPLAAYFEAGYGPTGFIMFGLTYKLGL